MFNLKPEFPHGPLSMSLEQWIRQWSLCSPQTKTKIYQRTRIKLLVIWVIGKQHRIHPGLQPYSSGSEPSLSWLAAEGKRTNLLSTMGKRQFQETLLIFCLLFPLLENWMSYQHKKMLKAKVEWSLDLWAVPGAVRQHRQRTNRYQQEREGN